MSAIIERGRDILEIFSEAQASNSYDALESMLLWRANLLAREQVLTNRKRRWRMNSANAAEERARNRVASALRYRLMTEEQRGARRKYQREQVRARRAK